MTVIILPRRASSLGKIPSPGQLADGEFAVDPYSGLMYVGTTTNYKGLNIPGPAGPSVPGPPGPSGPPGAPGPAGVGLVGDPGFFQIQYNQNLNNVLILQDGLALGWQQIGPISVIIPTGVTISAVTVLSPALDASGLENMAQPTVQIVNNGRILGCPGGPGQQGGTGFFTRVSTTLINNGQIIGGAAGGGGSQGFAINGFALCTISGSGSITGPTT